MDFESILSRLVADAVAGRDDPYTICARLKATYSDLVGDYERGVLNQRKLTAQLEAAEAKLARAGDAVMWVLHALNGVSKAGGPTQDGEHEAALKALEQAIMPGEEE